MPLHGRKCKMQLQYRTIDYINSLILVGHGPALLIIGGACNGLYIAYAVPIYTYSHATCHDELHSRYACMYDTYIPV